MNSTKTLLAVSSILALAALALFTSAAVAGSALVAVAFVTIFASDYTRAIKTLAPRATVASFPRPVRSMQACEQAA